jgi:16S rRNA (guanine527-N7)-methyltransferase
MPPEALVEGPGALDALARPVSRETRDRLAHYVELLGRWQKIKNLVGPGTLEHVWTRHMLDSAAVLDIAPDVRTVVDLGSGAGFPGMVVAVMLAGTPGAAVHLVEANARKGSFLRTVARETGAPATVHIGRIEDVVPVLARTLTPDLVTARALAPLDQLLGLAEPLLATGATGLFHKGRELADEIAATRDHWGFDLVEHPSRTDPAGRLVDIRGLRRLG